MINKNDKIFIAGHKGLVGSAIFRYLREKNYKNIIVKDRKELDLNHFSQTKAFFEFYRPKYVFLAAAKVGGIIANNNYPAEFIYENLQIQNNVIHLSYEYKVKKLLFLASSCIYPKECSKPIKENYLLSSFFEPTSEPYSIAKVAGIKMCQSYNRQYKTCFISCMPTNLYGPNDNFHLENSHVLPALIRRFYEAKYNNYSSVTLWGDGSARREFLYVDDIAKACLFLMDYFNPSEKENEKGEIFLNIGVGKDISILELAELIKKLVQFQGKILWDHSKPNGMQEKILDVSKINRLGWKSSVSLKEGIQKTFTWFLKNYDRVRKS